jgi:hypothetical protein
MSTSVGTISDANRCSEEFWQAVAKVCVEDPCSINHSDYRALPEPDSARTRWHGRCAVACQRELARVKKDLVSLHGAHKRVEQLHLTGDLTDENLMRFVIAVLNVKVACSANGAYQIANDQEAYIGPCK